MARPNTIHTCFVCVNDDCTGNGSPRILEMLTERLAGTGVELKQYVCFGACDYGPNIVMYPEGTLYNGVQPSDVDDLVAHGRGVARVERLTGQCDPMLQEMALMLLDAELG